MNILTRTI